MAPESLVVDGVYAQLHSLITKGHFAPGEVIVVQKLAETVGTSISPIRDALQRLVGARLVEALAGGGFGVPAMTDGGLRVLYEWHHQVARLAIRCSRSPISINPQPYAIDADDAASAVAATVDIFDQIAGSSDNPEHLIAIRNAGDRLHFARIVEHGAAPRRITVADDLAHGVLTVDTGTIRETFRYDPDTGRLLSPVTVPEPGPSAYVAPW